MADVAARIDGRRLSLFVYDLSMDGCMIQSATVEVQEGHIVTLELDTRCVATGTVIWRKNLTAGLQFRTRLNPRVVARLLEAAAQNPYAQDALPPPVDRSVLRVDHRKVDPPRSERVAKSPRG